MKLKRLTLDGVLTAIALTIFLIEAQIPVLIPVPGVKLGLANIITVVSALLLGPWDALAILTCRVVLGSIFSGQLMTLCYSAAGGLLCWLSMTVLRRVTDESQVWVLSMIGALAHNVGQLGMAVLITGTPALVCYLPVLTISALLTGLFTGLCARFTLKRLRAIGVR